MSAHAPARDARPSPARPGAAGAVAAVWRRDMLRLLRNSAAMISSLAIPSIFILAFHAAFSRTAEAFVEDYAAFVLPAAVLQAVIFTAGGSCFAVAEDREDGFHQRILSMATPTWTIVAGRMAADLTRMSWSGAVAAGVAVLLGARFHGGPWTVPLFILTVAAVTVVICAAVDGLVLLTAKPVSTSLTFQGLTVVLLMFSTAFVPASALPEAVAPVVRHLPVSVFLDTMRRLMAGESPGGVGAEALAWAVGLTVLGLWGFTRALRRNHG